MGEGKKEPKLNIAEADVEFKKSVDELTEAIVEDLHEGYQSDLEPFEAYAQRIRTQVHSNLDDFRDRFLKGYEVLLEEIASEGVEKKEGEPPPGAIKM